MPARVPCNLPDKIVAEAILEHLQLCGWRLEHKAKPAVAPARYPRRPKLTGMPQERNSDALAGKLRQVALQVSGRPME